MTAKRRRTRAPDGVLVSELMPNLVRQLAIMATANRGKPAIALAAACDTLYAVWQEGREYRALPIKGGGMMAMVNAIMATSEPTPVSMNAVLVADLDEAQALAKALAA
jgi:hypothetical protein